MGAGAAVLTPRSIGELKEGLTILYNTCAAKAEARQASPTEAAALASANPPGNNSATANSASGGGVVYRKPRPPELIVRRPSLEQVPLSDIEVWREAFDLIDAEKRQKLGETELDQLFQKLGKQVEKVKLTEMIREVDKVGDGFVDFESFCSMMKNQIGFGPAAMSDDDVVWDAFAHFDEDQDGSITEGELKSALFKLFGPMEEADVVAMIDLAMGHSTSGKIDFETFKDMIAADDEDDG